MSVKAKGVTQKQWISENGMTRNQYYYWQRKVRKAAYLEQHSDLPQPVTSNTTPCCLCGVSIGCRESELPMRVSTQSNKRL